MAKNPYNGWYNKATWNISLMYEELFTELCDIQNFDDVEAVADAFRSMIEELELDPIENHAGLAYWAVQEILGEVDWMELATHFGEEKIAEQMEEERLNNCELAD